MHFFGFCDRRGHWISSCETAFGFFLSKLELDFKYPLLHYKYLEKWQNGLRAPWLNINSCRNILYVSIILNIWFMTNISKLTNE